jgi:hypothetical protein
MQITRIGLCLLLAVSALVTRAQQSTLTPLPLNDLSAFRPQAGNWRIVGDVTMDPNVDIHAPAPAKVEPAPKKSKKDVAAPPVVPAVTSQTGTGILLNLNNEQQKDQLVSIMEHGDIDLELEVMLPKGSNSGIYLQGRYEVQLFDSWGVRNPKYSDIGGIYRNWENQPGKIYMGKAPLSNPAKAPGLWQKMKISFQAPRFDASGNKIANAKFLSVELNGVKIHDQVEVPLPTGGPIENNEKALGPLVIQGDHGPVAFRNIQYRMNGELKVTVSPVSFKAFKGPFKEVAEFLQAKPVKEGTTPKLTCEVLEDEDGYGITYSGTVTVPADNTYEFFLAYTGGAVLQVNGKTLVDFQRPDAWQLDHGTIELKAGTYPFVIHNFKGAAWMPPRMGFGVKTASSAMLELHDYNSYPPDDSPTSPILIQAGSQPRLLRAFVDFKNDRSRRITHSIGVGDPNGVNYVYDLGAGNLACVWRGDFVDATPMWHDRGDGSFKPMGAVQFLYMNQSLAFLTQPGDVFPATGQEGAFRSKGYVMDEQTGRPTFRYQLKDLQVDEKVYPLDNGLGVTREIILKDRGTTPGLTLKLAEGTKIDRMPDGSYAIDDKQYYIKTSSPVSVRQVNGVKELVTAVDGTSVKYTIVW